MKKGVKNVQEAHHDQVPLKEKEHFVLFKVSKLGHVLGEEECLLHSVSYVANLPMVKIHDRGV